MNKRVWICRHTVDPHCPKYQCDNIDRYSEVCEIDLLKCDCEEYVPISSKDKAGQSPTPSAGGV